MNLVIGLHHHKHGVDIHAFDVESPLSYSEGDFIDFLNENDEDFDQERDWVEIMEIEEGDIKKVKKT